MTQIVSSSAVKQQIAMTLLMAPSQPSHFLEKQPAFPSPKKNNFLPFKDKLELIRKCEAGIVHSVVALQMGVPRSTVSIIWKNRDKYHETAASCKCFY
ncbi:hypothetical protein E2C01_041977 [Portunus trituberculatus]|uniref:HTH psq-type domain-containing protein n=1 Tax=Portunus trituberculatus TaxID=210409 RepID=A0A5B7FSF7_PORTR|nr:hypothetical protein [Portunus trituberculatus]